jgi:hypothetical protein
MYHFKYLPRLDARERVHDAFEFRFDREFRAIIVIEVLDTLATYLAPEFVLINYLMIELVMIASERLKGSASDLLKKPRDCV